MGCSLSFSLSELFFFHVLSNAGLCLVQRPFGGARRDFLVLLRRRYGRCSGWTIARHLGLVPTVPDSQRLPQNGWCVVDIWFKRWKLVERRKILLFDDYHLFSFWFVLFWGGEQIIWRTVDFINIYVTHLLHKSSATLIWWSPASPSRYTKASRKKNGRSKGE